MKNILMSFMAFVMSLVSVTACIGNITQKPSASKTESTDKIKTDKINMSTPNKTLIVFFSHTGENYAVGNIAKGNTHIIADMIAEATGAETFEIIPATPYPHDSYEECIDVAKKELQSQARPAIKNDIDLSKYDTVFLGYPNWWGQPPMCVFTFIEGHDWTGKTVIPFITHEGSGMGGTDRKIAAACHGADVAVGKGLAVRGATAQNDRETARKAVNAWLNKLK